MYYILTLTTGQPLILYQEDEKVYLYSVANGRITARGLLFDDFKSDLKIFDNRFVSYQSTNNQCKVYKLTAEHFVELFALPVTTKIFEFNGDIFIFYDNHKSLYCIKCSSINKSSLILKDVTNYDLAALNNYFLLNNEERLYKIDDSMKISPLELDTSKVTKLESEIEKKKKEISSLKATQKSITEQYNDLASYAGKLQDELRKHRYIN